MMMNEREIADVIADVLENAGLGELVTGEAGEVVSIRTFEQAMVLSGNAGIVVKIGNAEFQLSIVRSR